MRSRSFLVSIGIHLSVFSVNGRRSPGCLLLGVFSPEFSPTCRIFDRQERTWRELSNLFRAYEFPGFALFLGCTMRRKALRSLDFWLPLSSVKRILISGVFRGSQKTRNQVTGNRPWVRIPPPPLHRKAAKSPKDVVLITRKESMKVRFATAFRSPSEIQVSERFCILGSRFSLSRFFQSSREENHDRMVPKRQSGSKKVLRENGRQSGSNRHAYMGKPGV